jgi:ATP-dependent helicase HrpB
LTSAEQAERAAQQSTPEILQSDLSGLVMELLQWGCPIRPAHLAGSAACGKPHRCAHLLTQLGALEGERLTARGRKWRRWATIRVWRRCWWPRKG